jgi:hypothetical protein
MKSMPFATFMLLYIPLRPLSFCRGMLRNHFMTMTDKMVQNGDVKIGRYASPPDKISKCWDTFTLPLVCLLKLPWFSVPVMIQKL